MTTARHLSPFQYSQHPDGSPRLADFPGLTLHTVEEQGSATGRDWATELNLPTYWEEWERLARPRSTKYKGRITFVVCDESETRLLGRPRLSPKQLALPTQCNLELAHEGFLIGTIYQYSLGIETLRARLNLNLPAELEGDFLVACASFFDSSLADKAREGIRRKILSHVCPNILTPPGAPIGTGLLAQVTLTTSDFPGCENSRILDWSE